MKNVKLTCRPCAARPQHFTARQMSHQKTPPLARCAKPLALLTLVLMLAACGTTSNTSASNTSASNTTASTPPASGTTAPDPVTANATAKANAYAKPINVWPAGMLDNPAVAARIPRATSLPSVAKAKVEPITIGMTPQDLTQQLGQPAATDDKHQRWQYLVKDDKGLFAVTFWFNTDGRTWMASTSEPFSGPLPPAPASVVVASPARSTPLKTWSLGSKLLFAFDSDKLKTGSTELQAIAREIAQYPQARIQLQAHSDRLGNPTYNQRLSQRRAEAIRQYLIKSGIPAQNITSEGLGDKQPVVDCAANQPRPQLIDCLAPNRRVVISAHNPTSSKP